MNIVDQVREGKKMKPNSRQDKMGLNLKILKCVKNFDGVSHLDNFYKMVFKLVSLFCVGLCPRKGLN